MLTRSLNRSILKAAHPSLMLSGSLVLLGLFLSAACQAQEAVSVASPSASPHQTLVWQDEFDGDSLDFNKWGIEVNAFGGGNNEMQIYTDRSENVRVEDGLLILEARRDGAAVSGIQREYSSGRVRTKHRGDWKFGRIEVRAKLPTGQGLWPAIWMLPTDNEYGVWASSGEIDIMELDGKEPEVVLGTLHYGGQYPRNTYTGSKYELEHGTFHDDFHVFSVDWTPGKIEWSIDGKLYQTQTKWHSEAGKFPAPFDKSFHLLLNVAVGGNFLEPPTDATVFPQQMQVDYVRVYQ